MRLRTLFFVSLLCAPALVMGQDAGITMTYQGTLSDAGGQTLNAERDIAFRLYTEVNGGDALWTERHRGLEVIDGVALVAQALSLNEPAGEPSGDKPRRSH